MRTAFRRAMQRRSLEGEQLALNDGLDVCVALREQDTNESGAHRKRYPSAAKHFITSFGF
ncbi:MAG: hypothetical protein JNL62_29985 [Bryobacterales bacterium]|nr:hypothetical protein [Bryobacterales bacterium]